MDPRVVPGKKTKVASRKGGGSQPTNNARLPQEKSTLINHTKFAVGKTAEKAMLSEKGESSLSRDDASCAVCETTEKKKMKNTEGGGGNRNQEAGQYR